MALVVTGSQEPTGGVGRQDGAKGRGITMHTPQQVSSHRSCSAFCSQVINAGLRDRRVGKAGRERQE